MSTVTINTCPVRYGTAIVDGARIFYREVGNRGSPAVVLLHDFLPSTHMYRNLLPALADGYYVIAPDYPGYADSDTPDPATFRYSFERISALINGLLEQKLVYSYAMYVAGYGAPVGWRLALAHPDRISALIIQNGDAHEESLHEFWNRVKSPKVQACLREWQPPMLLIWGKQDRIYAVADADPYKRDLKDLEFPFLDTCHFALEDPAADAFTLIRDFLDRRVQIKPGPGVS